MCFLNQKQFMVLFLRLDLENVKNRSKLPKQNVFIKLLN